MLKLRRHISNLFHRQSNAEDPAETQAAQSDASGPSTRSLAVTLLVFIAVSAVTRGFFFIEPPGRDQSLFLTQGSMLASGLDLYTHIWEHKPPGVIFAYAGAMTLFGKSYLAVQMVNWLSGLLTAIFLWWFLHLFGTRHIAVLIAGSLYLLFFSGIPFGGYWATAQAEVFIDPLTALSLCLVAGGMKGSISKPVALFVTGTCTAGALFLKYSTLPLVLIATPLIISSRHGWKQTAKHAAVYGLGLVWPWGVFASILAATDRFTDFVDATIRFNLLHQQVSSRPLLNNLPKKLFYQFWLLLPCYLLAAIAVTRTAIASLTRRFGKSPHTGRSKPNDNRKSLLLFWGFALWTITIIQIFWQSKFWIYHYHVILIPLCLFAAVGLDDALQIVQSKIPGWRSAVVLSSVLLLSLVPFGLSFIGYNLAHGLSAHWSGNLTREIFWNTYTWGKNDYNYLENRVAAQILKETTSPVEPIFIWGFEPGIYFHANRQPASRFLYDYPLMPTFQSVHERYINNLLSDLEKHPPSRFIVLQRDGNAIEPVDSLTQLKQLTPLHDFFSSRYSFDWQRGDIACFTRIVKNRSAHR